MTGRHSKAFIAKVLAAIMAVILFTPGCFTSFIDYRSEYPELYSVAINTILGSTGYILDEIKFDSEITVLEEDTHGRVLFIYSEDNLVSTYSLVISQVSNGEHVWFYPDYCFISSPTDAFSEEGIAKLKEMNDWGLELDLSKCVRVEIVRKKQLGPISDKKVDSLLYRSFGYEVQRWWFSFFITDAYGRSIYLGEGIPREAAAQEWFCVLMMFNPDGSFDEEAGFHVLSDPFNYQDELRVFKEQNGWGTPPG